MKLRTLLTLAIASLCSWQGAWADRVAPTFPEPTTLVSGNTYYLYNVGSQKFVYRSDSYVRANATTRTGIIITDKEDGTYTMQFSDNNTYIWTSSSDMKTQSSVDADVYFRFAEVEGGYTIQRNRNYDETNYVANNSDYYVYANQTSGNIVWQLFDQDGAEAVVHYKAKKALYDALEAAVGYEFATADYEAVYANEASTTAELNAAATALNKSLSMSNGYKAPWWNERPILFYTADGSFGQNEYDTWRLPNYSDNAYRSGTSFYRYLRNSGQTSSISATVMIEEPSTLVYSLSDNPTSIDVYIDGELVQHFGDEQCNHYPSVSNDTYARFFLELSPGLHTITWTQTALAWRGYSGVSLRNVGVMAMPQITVNLLEPGSLGTEVLYNTDHVKNVRRLKVKGAMNSEDWTKIKMMSTLLELDLSEAQFTEIPAQQFRVYSGDTTMVFLHKVTLPEGLTKINREAFYYSFVEEVNFPSTLQSIGNSAFYESHIREIDMPDNLTDMGTEVFNYAYWLTSAKLPKNMTTIPERTFNDCYYLDKVILPEKLETINTYAFHECHSLWQATLPQGLKIVGSRAFEGCWYFYPRLPEGLTTIRNAAFNTCNAMDSLIVPSSVTTIEEYAFCNCANLKYAELSVEQYTTPKGIFDNTPKLETIKLNSATVVSPTISGGVYPHRNIAQLTLKVPHYLVNSYKLHSYWYNAKAIEPFDYSDVEYIPIHGNLTLNHERFGGQPSIHVLQDNCYLKINGENEQKFDEIWISTHGTGNTGQLLNNCDNVTASGDNRLDFYSEAKKWYFISLPFDLDVSRITPWTEGGQYAIRYYDGEGRATNGKSGNWKNVDRTSVIPAGTGFIFQTNIGMWTGFYAADTENKYGTLRTTDFNKTLDVNASETASNKGWNLVGNPYQCFYNNHCLNFTAPITVWNGSTYVAYSLTDDDYAIRPNEAFFVQCPNEEYATIGFPIQGRQLTSVIESQNAAPALDRAQESARKLIDIELTDGEQSDKTRFVLNPQAKMDYEPTCDASKFLSMDAAVPQIYTVENGDMLAINERPVGDGTVQLGVKVAVDGTYTISAPRNQFQTVVLIDRETSVETDLSQSDYTFSAKAGSNDARFVLSMSGVTITGVSAIGQSPTAIGNYYNLNGQRVDGTSKGIYIVNGKKVVVK